MSYKPPFTISSKILNLTQRIAHALGAISAEMLDLPPVTPRRQNNIKTIQASLAIEGNTLGLDQVNSILEGKRVIGPTKDIIEARNALSIYEKIDTLDPLSIKDFLYAHKVLMEGLINESGTWRSTEVGIFNRKEVAHVAPPARRVPLLMKDLFGYLKKERDLPWILKACIFHYELEFIHPFIDGNGRMGRLWQQLILLQESTVFKYVSVETIIKESQQEYYDVLGQCDRAGDLTLFIEYGLGQIMTALERYRQSTEPAIKDPGSRLEYASHHMQGRWFTRKEYLRIFRNISTATASRDLLLGLNKGLLELQGEKNRARYAFITHRNT